MANEKNDICSIVKKCKILLLDIEGTTTSISFVKDKLFPYAEENVKEFLNSEWETENVKECVIALRKLALEDEENKVDGVVAIPGEDASKEDQIESLVKSVKWQMSSDRKVGPLKQLQGLIWKKGYDKGDIKGHVYEDVLPALELWRSVEGQKVYIYSSGSVQAQKLLFGLSSAGDMLKLIDGHFDTAVGAKQESSSYTTIAEKIGCNPEDILFLTDIDKEAEAARSAGVQAALVSREGNAPLDESVTSCYPVLYSFTELAVTNKRKPDVQEEQPTKVLKTDVEADVKTESETGLKDNSEKPDETEKMEVEEEPVVKSVLPTEKTTENVIEKIETTVEEVTEANKVVDMPICDAEPIIDENPKKTEEKETETMETETAETVSPVPAVLEPEENNECKNGDGDAPVSNESPPAVITEIKDITNDKESLDDVVEMIDDLVPVVEEPPTEDMEDLQNVGEVLEKECDEILSKVQDVTNLDNIPLKPLLNTITEEAMETENTDSNDIVDRILDTELELEMKQCADNDLNIAQEIEKPKELIEKQEDVLNNEIPAAVDEENATKGIEEEKRKKIEESSLTAAKEECSLSEDKNTENSAAEETTDKFLTEVKIGESSPTEEKKLESSLSEQKIEENITQEPQNLTSSAGEPVEKVNLTDKQGVEVSATNKIEANETEHTAEERSSPPVKDSITTAEIVKEISAESKIDEIEVVLDEKNKKSEAENANDNMETDVSTTKIDDIASTAEVNTSESNLNTQEKDLEIREAATDTTIEVLEKSSEKDSLETVQTETGTETKDCDKITTDDVVSENATKESQVNGKTTNGDADMVNLNGDSSKDEELSSRLSMENGQEVVNGANGDSTVVEKNTNENNGDDLKDVADMKVKTVVVDEPRNDPIEQPMEA